MLKSHIVYVKRLSQKSLDVKLKFRTVGSGNGSIYGYMGWSNYALPILIIQDILKGKIFGKDLPFLNMQTKTNNAIWNVGIDLELNTWGKNTTNHISLHFPL